MRGSKGWPESSSELARGCFEVKRRESKFSPLAFVPHLRPRRPAMPIPPLPFELTTEILRLDVTDLVEQERNDVVAAASPTNAFLRSACLVSKTWRSIAAPALIRNGLVAPSGVDGFLRRLDACGRAATWKSVRFGPGGRVVGKEGRERDGDADGDGLFIIEQTPSLNSLTVPTC